MTPKRNFEINWPLVFTNEGPQWLINMTDCSTHFASQFWLYLSSFIPPWSFLKIFKLPCKQLARLLWIASWMSMKLMTELPNLWQYRLWSLLWSFKSGDTKLEWFLPKNHHIQGKLLNFQNWCSGEVSKSAKIWHLKSIFYVKNQ